MPAKIKRLFVGISAGLIAVLKLALRPSRSRKKQIGDCANGIEIGAGENGEHEDDDVECGDFGCGGVVHAARRRSAKCGGGASGALSLAGDPGCDGD